MRISDHFGYDKYKDELVEKYSITSLGEYISEPPSYNKLYALYPDAPNLESLQKAGALYETIRNRSFGTDIKEAVGDFVKNASLQELQQLPPSMLIDLQQITVSAQEKENFEKLNLALNMDDQANEYFSPTLQKAAENLGKDAEYIQLFKEFKTASPEGRLAYFQKMADEICNAAGIEHVDVRIGRVGEGAGAEQVTRLIGDDYIRIPESLLLNGELRIGEMPHEVVHIIQNDLARKVLSGDIQPNEPGYMLGRAYVAQEAGQAAGLMSTGFGMDYFTRTTEEHAYLVAPSFEQTLIRTMLGDEQASQVIKGTVIYGSPVKYGVSQATRERLKAEGNPSIDRQDVPAILGSMGAEADKPYANVNFDQSDEYKRQRLEKVSSSFSGDFDYIKENLDGGLREKRFAAMLKDGQLSQEEIAVLKAHIKPESKEDGYIAESIDAFAKFINEGVTADDGMTAFQELKALKVEMYMPEAMQEVFDQSPPPATPNVPAGSRGKQL